MDRRTFMKVMAGLASIPVVGKFFKGAKVASKVAPVAEKAAATSSGQPPAYFFNYSESSVLQNFAFVFWVCCVYLRGAGRRQGSAGSLRAPASWAGRRRSAPRGEAGLCGGVWGVSAPSWCVFCARGAGPRGRRPPNAVWWHFI